MTVTPLPVDRRRMTRHTGRAAAARRPAGSRWRWLELEAVEVGDRAAAALSSSDLGPLADRAELMRAWHEGGWLRLCGTP